MRPLRLTLAAVFLSLVIAVGALQFHHHSEYGHFVPFGLHADVTFHQGDTGIPGMKQFVDAHLTNFRPLPHEIETCNFISDAGRGVSIAYRLERFKSETQAWEILFDTAKTYCRPYPLAIAHGKIVKTRLWPGQTVSTGARAAGTDESNGDMMRVVVESGGHDFPTSPYAIIKVERQMPASP